MTRKQRQAIAALGRALETAQMRYDRVLELLEADTLPVKQSRPKNTLTRNGMSRETGGQK